MQNLARRALPALVQVDLEQARGSHAAADAHRDHDVLLAAALAFDERVHHDARTAHAVRMTDRDRTAVDVQLLVRDAERVAAVDRLHRERLVEFPRTDVVDREPVALEQIGHREDGADPHLAWIAATHDQPAIEAERLDPARARSVGIHYHDRRRPFTALR